MAALSSLVPALQPAARWLVQVAGENGLQPRVTSTYRSLAYQSKLYRRYQAGLTPYPVAPPGASLHNYGLAFDMVTSPMAALPELGRLWVDIGGVYGGERDPVHFQAGGVSSAQLAPPDALEWAYKLFDDHPYLTTAIEIAFPGIGITELALTVLHYVRKGFN